jgi:hypothetical protein
MSSGEPGKEGSRSLCCRTYFLSVFGVRERVISLNHAYQLGENQWWAIRIGPAMKDRIKYVAAYQVAPVGAVTHIAEVADIRPYKDTGKYAVVFTQPAVPVGPIKPKDTRFSPQGPIYVQRERLLSAKALEDAL